MMDKFTVKKDDAVLMVIDIQERLVPAMPYGQQVVRNTNILSTAAAKLDIPILVTEQYPRGLGKTIAEVAEKVNGAPIYEKMTFSACTDEISAALEQTGKKKVIITGMETHVCVFQTVRSLLERGYRVFVIEDAVCSRTKENYRSGLALMSAMGAVVTNTETVVFDLMKEAGTPLFKELSKLIK